MIEIFELPKSKAIEKMLKASHKCRERAADKWFSRYIRLRDLLEDIKEDGLKIVEGRFAIKCRTCGALVPEATNTSGSMSGAECGHYQTRNNRIFRFEPTNCNTQCKVCNRYKNGNVEEHAKFINKKYGEGTAEELANIAKSTPHYKRSKYELLQIEQSCKKSHKEMLEELKTILASL
jgi:hypothetical protein